MTILNNIREKSIEARKSKDSVASSLLVTLLSEVAMIGKNANRETTDAEAVAVIKKFINNNKETLGLVLEIDEVRGNALAREIAILETFLPTQLSADDLETVIKTIIYEVKATTPKEMGVVMKTLKERHEGTYDSKVASDLVKKLLS